jgi:PKD repeat protein
VSGAAAVALSANPSLTNAQLWSLLTGTTRDLAAAGKDDGTGHGLLNMGAVLSGAGSAPAPVPNQPPVARFTATTDGLNVTVDASGSSDPDGSIVKYRWAWGDGLAFESGTCAQYGHAYAGAGTYTITLTVTDAAGATHSVSQAVTLAAPAPSPAPSMHVGDLTGMAKKSGKTEKLTWSVRMVDANGSPVAGATVKATANGQALTATTSSTGIATFVLSVPNKAGVSYTLCVADAAAAGWTYDAAANVRSCLALVTV